MVESRCGAVVLGRAYPLPPLSSGGVSIAQPSLRFHILLIEPDVRNYRIRLSDKTSRLRTREVANAEPNRPLGPWHPSGLRSSPALRTVDATTKWRHLLPRSPSRFSLRFGMRNLSQPSHTIGVQ